MKKKVDSSGAISQKLCPTELLHVKIVMPKTFDYSQISNSNKEYSLDDMNNIKETLNKTKDKLDKYYLDHKQGPVFGDISNSLVITSTLKSYIANKLGGQLVTRAWLKFYELYTYYNLIQDDIYAFLNAELPGASICALNHLMKTVHDKKFFEWYASSIYLNSQGDNQSNALGDKYGIWAMNKEKWLMRIDVKDPSTTPGSPNYENNGDCTKSSNLADFEIRLKNKPINLYTHDAGINVGEMSQNDTGFNTQELKNAKIHLGCALAGLLTLKVGGNFIAKQYTFFEPFTINLIMIYSLLFEEFYITKPMSSGASNSEIYLVGKSFLGMPSSVKSVLLDRLDNFNFLPFIEKKDLPISVMKEIFSYNKILAKQQISYINESIVYYEHYKNEQRNAIYNNKTLLQAKDKFKKLWLQRNKILPIKPSDYLASIKKKNERE